MEDKVIERLKALGYPYDKDKDTVLIQILLESVGERIKNRINDTDIPEGLCYAYVDMVCGEFLKQKKSSGQLLGFDFEQAVDSIKMGDVTVALQDGASAEQQFDQMVREMLNHDEDLLRYRKLVW